MRILYLLGASLLASIAIGIIFTVYLNGLGNGGDLKNLTRIDAGSVLEPGFCRSKGLDTQVTVFHSPECPACRETLPILEEIQNESLKKFEFIDITTDRERILELGIVPGHIPLIIVNCEAYVGYMTKAEFEKLLS